MRKTIENAVKKASQLAGIGMLGLGIAACPTARGRAFIDYAGYTTTGAVIENAIAGELNPASQPTEINVYNDGGNQNNQKEIRYTLKNLDTDQIEFFTYESEGVLEEYISKMIEKGSFPKKGYFATKLLLPDNRIIDKDVYTIEQDGFVHVYNINR